MHPNNKSVEETDFSLSAEGQGPHAVKMSSLQLSVGQRLLKATEDLRALEQTYILEQYHKGQCFAYSREELKHEFEKRLAQDKAFLKNLLKYRLG